MTRKIKCALIGPGNIGTDLLAKLQRSPVLEPVWMVGIDPESDGLKRAREMGIKTTHEGVDGLVPHMKADGVQIVFDATSAYVHAENSRKVNAQGALMIDLTPAAIGPYCVPPVNLKEHVGKAEMNVNMVTCGGQATIPMVAAVSRVQPVSYGEIVATVFADFSKPGLRKVFVIGDSIEAQMKALRAFEAELDRQHPAPGSNGSQAKGVSGLSGGRRLI
mgnify:CR=1 FL=1